MANLTRKRQKQITASKGDNSTRNGKQTPFFTIGGHGMKPHQDKKSFDKPFGWERCESSWNPGKCLPSTKFTHK